MGLRAYSAPLGRPDHLVFSPPGVDPARTSREILLASGSEPVQLAEQAFSDEFAKLVTHLCERFQRYGR